MLQGNTLGRAVWQLVDLVAIKGYCDRAEVKPEEGKIKGDVKTNLPRESPRRSIQGLIL